jgi:hypothetical protein
MQRTGDIHAEPETHSGTFSPSQTRILYTNRGRLYHKAASPSRLKIDPWRRTEMPDPEALCLHELGSKPERVQRLGGFSGRSQKIIGVIRSPLLTGMVGFCYLYTVLWVGAPNLGGQS